MGKRQLRFAAMTDLHLDIMHDGMMRMEAFLTAAAEADVDFIIQLGDFSYPTDTSTCLCLAEKLPVNLRYAMECPTSVPKLEILQRFNAFPKPHFHLLGNHECDFCSKEEALRMYGMPRRYDAVRLKGWHLILLDGNSYRNARGEIVPYHFGEYFGTDDLPYMDEEQLAWLERELADGEEPVVLFCHQPLYPCIRGLRNAQALQAVIRSARQRGRRIRLCMNGHVHRDLLHREDGILYYTLNSISNYWAGPAYACRRYDARTEAAFPNLQFVVPYARPVFAIVTLDDAGITVQGIRGRFVPPHPRETGITLPLTPSVRSWQLAWDKA